MGKVSFKVRIPYRDITMLRSDLASDTNLDASVGEPVDIPSDSHTIVEIRVVVDSQGPAHKQLLKSKIEFNNGSIVGILDDNIPSFGSKVISWLKEISLGAIFIYVSIIGAGILYHRDVLHDLDGSIGLTIFVLTMIPISLGLASTPKLNG